MPKAIQIRGVPEEIHRTLKARAAQAGMTLTEYLLQEITHVAHRPTIEELLARIKSRGSAGRSIDSVGAVRKERDSRR